MLVTSDNLVTMLKSYQKLHFLVVDDFENFRMSLRQMLRAFGAEHIDTASSGHEAVSKCTFNRFDIVLCDYNLGSGKNGQQVLEELRYKKLLKRTSIFVMVTAETSRDMVMGARECQPDGYITKPITKAVLEQRMNGLIAQREALYAINKEIDLEDYPKAISLSQQALKTQPRYRTHILRILGELYLLTGDLAHAKKTYEDVMNARDMPWARMGLGRVLMAQNQLDDAIHCFELLITQSPDYMEAYDGLAEALKRQGKAKQAQTVLEDAVRLSPRIIVRQQQLAELATQNQDLSTALSALRNTLKLANHSVHDTPDNYLNLGRCLTELSESDDPELGAKHAEEALQTLQKLEKRFRDDEQAKLAGMMIEARVYVAQNKPDFARKLMKQIEERVTEVELTADAGIELARSLYAMKENDKADALLTRLADQYQDNPDVIQRIEALMDEPVGMQAKVQARSLNREGIAFFEQGHLDDAVQAFEDALKLVPRHAALNLNLVQVILKRIEKDGRSSELIQRCKGCLERVSYIPPQHRQHKRLEFLKRKLASLG
mgnify:CR=1 FL=1